MRQSPTSSTSTSLVIIMTSSTILLILPIVIYNRYRHNIKSFYHQHRGISGLLRYIWVGDYLPPNVRHSMNALDDVERRLMESTKEMERISMIIIIDDNQQQQTMQHQFDGEDGNEKTTKNRRRADDYQSPLYSSSFERVDPKLLRTRIALYSNTLDTLASMIDSIMSYNDDDVKSRKKSLSNTIVKLMDDFDKLISRTQT